MVLVLSVKEADLLVVILGHGLNRARAGCWGALGMGNSGWNGGKEMCRVLGGVQHKMYSKCAAWQLLMGCCCLRDRLVVS